MESSFQFSQVPYAKTHHGSLKALIRERNLLSVSLNEQNAVSESGTLHPRQACLYHRAIEIIQDHPTRRTHVSGCQHREISGAPTHVDHRVPSPQPHHVHCSSFPKVMNTKAQDGIHQIVFSGNGTKMPLDPVNLFIYGNL
jgi:hypothetical protein